MDYKKMKCKHENIVIVEEIPTNGNTFQTSKKYVKCEKCGIVLPILRVTNETIYVDLYEL